MSNSKKKMKVTVTKNFPWGNQKEWVKVELNKGNVFVPSFEDLYRIVQAISFCEDRKYPTGKGRDMVAEFLHDAVYSEDWDSLEQKYRIPKRCGSHIVEANGADIKDVSSEL